MSVPASKRFRASSVAFIILERADGSICAFERHGTGWMDGQISLPAGGVERGESLRAAAVREAREEVGVEIEESWLSHVHVLHCRVSPEDCWTSHFFLARQWRGEAVICEPARHRNLAWLSPDALPGTMVSYVKSALESWRRGESYSEHGW